MSEITQTSFVYGKFTKYPSPFLLISKEKNSNVLQITSNFTYN